MPYVDDLFQPQVPAAIAREIAGIDAATLKNWIARKPAVVLLTDAERAEAGQSTRFAFSILRVMQIAITAELVRLGLPPRTACLLAAGFTDLEEGPVPGTPGRKAGELFATGQTLLLAYPGDPFGRVMNATRETPWTGLMSHQVMPQPACVVLNMNPIVWRIRAALGLPVSVDHDR